MKKTQDGVPSEEKGQRFFICSGYYKESKWRSERIKICQSRYCDIDGDKEERERILKLGNI